MFYSQAACSLDSGKCGWLCAARSGAVHHYNQLRGRLAWHFHCMAWRCSGAVWQLLVPAQRHCALCTVPGGRCNQPSKLVCAHGSSVEACTAQLECMALPASLPGWVNKNDCKQCVRSTHVPITTTRVSRGLAPSPVGWTPPMAQLKGITQHEAEVRDTYHYTPGV
jgi:hypothetical protein